MDTVFPISAANWQNAQTESSGSSFATICSQVSGYILSFLAQLLQEIFEAEDKEEATELKKSAPDAKLDCTGLTFLTVDTKAFGGSPLVACSQVHVGTGSMVSDFCQGYVEAGRRCEKSNIQVKGGVYEAQHTKHHCDLGPECQ